MRAAQLEPSRSAGPDVLQALATIAEHARQRQQEQGPRGRPEPLLSWERVAEFDSFRITVRCDYNLEGT